MITGGFGMTTDLRRGTMRQWVMGRDGVKRWADSNAPVDAAHAPRGALVVLVHAYWSDGRREELEFDRWPSREELPADAIRFDIAWPDIDPATGKYFCRSTP